MGWRTGFGESLWLHEQEESSVRYLMSNGEESDLACAAFAYNLDGPSPFHELCLYARLLASRDPPKATMFWCRI